MKGNKMKYQVNHGCTHCGPVFGNVLSMRSPSAAKERKLIWKNVSGVVNALKTVLQRQ